MKIHKAYNYKIVSLLEADESADFYIIYKTLKQNEPRHDKTNIMCLRPAWIQTSLRIRAV
jgi:hypothetical protein